MKRLLSRSTNLQSQLIGMTSLLVVSLLLFITLSILNQASKTIEASTEDYVSEALSQLIKRHDMILNQYLTVTNSIVTHPSVQRALASLDKKNEMERLTDRQFVIDMLSTIGSENKGILALSIHSAGQEFTYGSVNMECAKSVGFSSYEEAIKRKKGKFLWVKVLSGCNYPMLLGMRDMKHIAQIDQSLGTLYILLDWNRHRDLFENTVFMQDDANLLVANAEGETVVFSGRVPEERPSSWLQQLQLDQYKWQDAGVFDMEIDDKTHLVTYQTSGASGWKFISLIPKDRLLGGIRQIKTYSINIGMVALGLAFLFSVVFARKISHPVRQLVKAMTVVENEHISVQLPKSRWLPILEMEILKDKFAHMSRRIRGLIRENYIGKINEQEARLQALQSQINPHFLYNTLDSLYWKLQQNNEQQVSGMILALSNCLRYAISQPLQSVPLMQELEYIERYVEIQNARFGGKIHLDIDIDKAVESYPVFKLLLQPIVENAIIHGISPLEQGGTVAIHAGIDKESVVIRVSDDGVGMSEEQSERLLKNDRVEWDEYTGRGMGLSNVVRRIKLTYGDPYGLDIQSELYFGTTVIVELPNQMKTLSNELI